jgi:hypothetical protein
VGQDLKTFGRSLQRVHAPLGHAAPLAASALFACAGFSTSLFFRILAYGLSTALALLIGADLLQSLVDKSASDFGGAWTPKSSAPFEWFQILLTATVACVYTFFIFVGLGPWTPIYFLIPVFVVCWLVASRNVRLWYSQSLGYQARLREAEELEKRHQAYKQWLERHPPEDPLQRM